MSSEELLVVNGIKKMFNVSGKTLKAVDNVSFRIPRGKTLGLVGESGSGKSTVGRTVLRLLEPDGGSIRFDGEELTKLPGEALRKKRQQMQMIFQNPLSALNPRMSVGRIIQDPMIIHKMGTKKEQLKRVDELLERVGLPLSVADAYPTELSGGQQQRVGIARALALQPKLIVCDEAVSALDVSIQLQIIMLLQELQQEFNLTSIFISHNLAVVEYLSDEVAVMYLGEIVENGPVEEVFANPQHPYTRVLMDSVLKIPESGVKREMVEIRGEMPSPLNPPSGCAFHPRCPLATEKCRSQKPEKRLIRPGHEAACHFAG
ncbi:ABC transporter ATP-binding protein [Paenibacillus humicola]|uniref:ABC transporter ATP-binding protein n=1 Tax=Paenibacillus humicola TaxID=3110540 RepID=UPI00237B1C19|nr:ABC transporter ATP-binding protein [Paenibacillus humicola]